MVANVRARDAKVLRCVPSCSSILPGRRGSVPWCWYMGFSPFGMRHVRGRSGLNEMISTFPTGNRKRGVMKDGARSVWSWEAEDGARVEASLRWEGRWCGM